MVGPWIHALFGRRKRLSDIEYLAIKEFDGKLKQNDSVRTTVGDLAILTAATGKDMYVSKAKINAAYLGSVGNVDHTITVSLKLNDVIVETYNMEFIRGTARSDDVLSQSIEFVSIGQKVLAGETIRLDLTVIDNAAITVSGTLVCFEEDTGASPAV